MPISTVSRLNQLKQLGVKIAIDDFGTGYSSLAYLRQFPVDVLKIDRSFISSMDGSDDSHALIHTMVELGRALGLSTLAEGIEDEHQLACLREQQLPERPGLHVLQARHLGMIEVLMAHTARLANDPSARPSSAHVAPGR